MADITTRDGVTLHAIETGEGDAVLFLHEFAGDYRSWEPQIRRLSRRYRCIAYNARGFPPSDVPSDPAFYSQQKLVDEAFDVLDAMGVETTHLVAHSMGGYTALHMGLQRPERIKSVTIGGVGWGSDPAKAEENRALIDQISDMFRNQPIAESADAYANYPMRHRFKAKDPRGWADFAAMLAERSGEGAALTMKYVQGARPTLPEMESDLAGFKPPLLVIVGDEDEACIAGSLLLKNTVPDCGLLVLPWSSHTINSEEPDAFNAALMDFIGRAG